MEGKRIKLITAIIIVILLTSLISCIGVSAADEPVGEAPVGGKNSQEEGENLPTHEENASLGGEETPETEQNTPPSGDMEVNIFEEIYSALETNSDKIFSALAFIGTLVVSVGYKSGLLPLMRDALSRLKNSIDGVKADGELTKAETEQQLQRINSTLEGLSNELSTIKWQYESYDEIVREREALRTVMSGQVDMLYAIFMTSALPQYQKDEVGEKIAQMREELKNYESSEEN